MVVPGRSGGPSDFNQWTRRPRTTEYGPIGPLSEGSGLWLGSGAAVPHGMLFFQGGKGDAVVRGVAVGCAVWGSVDGDGGVEKRVCPDAIDAPGDSNVRQAGATEKRLKSNADDAVRDGDGSQAGHRKRPIPNAGDRRALHPVRDDNLPVCALVSGEDVIIMLKGENAVSKRISELPQSMKFEKIRLLYRICMA